MAINDASAWGDVNPDDVAWVKANSQTNAPAVQPQKAPDYTAPNTPGVVPAPPAPAPAGSGKGEGYDRAAAYYQSKGVTPYDTSLDSWNTYWNQWGKNDPNYFDKRLSQADEFTGKGPNYDWTRDPANAGALGGAAGSRASGNLSGYTSASSAPGFTGTVLAGAPTSADAGPLFQTLMRRANQGLAVDPNDPIIRNQVNAFDAAQTRSARTAQAQAAERGGPNANIDAEMRSTAEKAGQNTAGYQAQIMQNELTARRQEIQQALQGAQGFLTAQQQMALQEELAKMDVQLKNYQFGESQGQQESQFARDLAERGFEFDTNDEFRNSPLYGS